MSKTSGSRRRFLASLSGLAGAALGMFLKRNASGGPRISPPEGPAPSLPALVRPPAREAEFWHPIDRKES